MIPSTRLGCVPRPCHKTVSGYRYDSLGPKLTHHREPRSGEGHLKATSPRCQVFFGGPEGLSFIRCSFIWTCCLSCQGRFKTAAVCAMVGRSAQAGQAEHLRVPSNGTMHPKLSLLENMGVSQTNGAPDVEYEDLKRGPRCFKKLPYE